MAVGANESLALLSAFKKLQTNKLSTKVIAIADALFRGSCTYAFFRSEF